MKKIIIVLVILILVGIGIYLISKNSSKVPTDVTQQTSADSVTVSIKNFSFNPASLTVKKGAKVTWVNNDAVVHTITSDSADLFNSPDLSPGHSFSFTFDTPGSVGYHCNIHKTMKGTVIVENQ